MEDKRNSMAQRKHTSKSHIPSVSLFLCHKMMAVPYFVWSLALQLWSLSEWLKQTKFQVFAIFKKYWYPAAWKCFVVVNAIFDVRWTKFWFSLHNISLGWFLEATFFGCRCYDCPDPYLKGFITAKVELHWLQNLRQWSNSSNVSYWLMTTYMCILHNVDECCVMSNIM